jgi:hypothetical protein
MRGWPLPMMVMMMLLTMRRSIMAAFTLPLSLQIVGWIAHRGDGGHRRRDGCVMV